MEKSGKDDGRKTKRGNCRKNKINKKRKDEGEKGGKMRRK